MEERYRKPWIRRALMVGAIATLPSIGCHDSSLVMVLQVLIALSLIRWLILNPDEVPGVTHAVDAAPTISMTTISGDDSTTSAPLPVALRTHPAGISIVRTAVVPPDSGECSVSFSSGQGFAKFEIATDGEPSIWRRYSQFRTLQRTLSEECPREAAKVESLLPPKGWSNNLEPGFVQKRALGLERSPQSIFPDSSSIDFHLTFTVFAP